MFENLRNLFRKDSLYDRALQECHEMLDTDWAMYVASVESLRRSDTAEVPLDIYAADKLVNAAERDVRKKVMTHLAVAGAADLNAGLALVTVVIDVERIGDYTKNIYDLARNHPQRLQAGSLEPRLALVEAGVTQLFKDMIQAFKVNDADQARQIMASYKEELAQACESITMDLVAGRIGDLGSADAVAVGLYARYLKRIASHSRNIITSVVNPFHRIGYKEKPEGAR